MRILSRYLCLAVLIGGSLWVALPASAQEGTAPTEPPIVEGEIIERDGDGVAPAVESREPGALATTGSPIVLYVLSGLGALLIGIVLLAASGRLRLRQKSAR